MGPYNPGGTSVSTQLLPHRIILEDQLTKQKNVKSRSCRLARETSCRDGRKSTLGMAPALAQIKIRKRYSSYYQPSSPSSSGH